MNRSILRRPHIRRRLTWLVVVLLLWQQFAVAAYACTAAPVKGTAVSTQVSLSAMKAMGDDCARMPAISIDPTCHKHCQPDHSTQAEARSASVPPNALMALPPVPLSMAAVALPTRGDMARWVRFHAPPPAPRWMFCTLLI